MKPNFGAAEACSEVQTNSFDGKHTVILSTPSISNTMAELSSSDHDRIIRQWRSQLVEILSVVMDEIAEGHQFCFALLSNMWC